MRRVQLSWSYEDYAQCLLQNKESISFALMMMFFRESKFPHLFFNPKILSFVR